MRINYSLVIPCYNEEENIYYLYKKLNKLSIIKNLEIILVDNGSNDFTLKKLFFFKKKFKNLKIKILKIKKNKGFGYGVLRGFKISKGEYLCYTHADKETNIEDFKKVHKIIKKKPNSQLFIKGQRINRTKNNWTIIDKFFSISCDFVVSIILFTSLKDIHAQPTVIHKELFKKIGYYPNDFIIDAYFLYLAKKLNFEIIRVNVNFTKKKRKYGAGSSDTIFKKIVGGANHIISSLKILIKSNV